MADNMAPAAPYPDLSMAELDELLVCCDPSEDSSLPSSSSLPASLSASPVPPPSLSVTVACGSKKRPNRQPTVAVRAEQSMDHDERGLPVAVDEETRQARKMARNRKAAAVSRERKKQRVDELEEQVARLQEENSRLKSQLAQQSGGSETSETTSDVEWWPVSQQPEAFWTYAPLKKACTPPPFLHALLSLLTAPLWTLCLLTWCRSTSSRCSPSPAKATTTRRPSSSCCTSKTPTSERRPARRCPMQRQPRGGHCTPGRGWARHCACITGTDVVAPSGARSTRASSLLSEQG